MTRRSKIIVPKTAYACVCNKSKRTYHVITKVKNSSILLQKLVIEIVWSQRTSRKLGVFRFSIKLARMWGKSWGYATSADSRRMIGRFIGAKNKSGGIRMNGGNVIDHKWDLWEWQGSSDYSTGTIHNNLKINKLVWIFSTSNYSFNTNVLGVSPQNSPLGMNLMPCFR